MLLYLGRTNKNAGEDEYQIPVVALSYITEVVRKFV
jgi:hypothetical protein